MRLRSLLYAPPIWREGRWPIELAALLRDPMFQGRGVPDGGGRPVLLIPGFLASDDTLALMTAWLRRTGYVTSRAGIRLNVDCSSATVDRLAQRVQLLAERRGQRVAIIGQSRGGVFARVLATRHPDLVSGIVTLGSPLCSQLAVHPLVWLQVTAVGALGTLGAKGLFRHACLHGDCCAEFREALLTPFPRDVGFTSVYSRSDGIVDWRACLDPAALHQEVSSSHCGMGLNPTVYRVIAEALDCDAGRAAGDDPPVSGAGDDPPVSGVAGLSRAA
jgi:pimeloyl-ACP methyl ester carboxylesterase